MKPNFFNILPSVNRMKLLLLCDQCGPTRAVILNCFFFSYNSVGYKKKKKTLQLVHYTRLQANMRCLYFVAVHCDLRVDLQF